MRQALKPELGDSAPILRAHKTKTMMVFGEAKKVVEAMVKAVE